MSLDADKWPLAADATSAERTQLVREFFGAHMGYQAGYVAAECTRPHVFIPREAKAQASAAARMDGQDDEWTAKWVWGFQDWCIEHNVGAREH